MQHASTEQRGIPQDNRTTDCACINLQEDWNYSCEKAMGFDLMNNNSQGDEMDDDHAFDNDCDNSAVPVLNLLSTDDTTEEDSMVLHSNNSFTNSLKDPWVENCIRISESLDQMSGLIHRKQRAYARLVDVSEYQYQHPSLSNFRNQNEDESMTDQDRSVLESTVLSFAATTGNQIESLRQQSASFHSSSNTTGSLLDIDRHRAGIVACLLLRLREEVANPMAKLQKARSKRAVTIWNDPLHCELVTPQEGGGDNAGGWDDILDDNDNGSVGFKGGENLKFIPTSASPAAERGDWWVKGYDVLPIDSTSKALICRRPPSRWIHSPKNRTQALSTNSVKSTAVTPATTPPSSSKMKLPVGGSIKNVNMEMSRQQHSVQSEGRQLDTNRNDEIARESVLLLQKVQNEDLDSIQKVSVCVPVRVR